MMEGFIEGGGRNSEEEEIWREGQKTARYDIHPEKYTRKEAGRDALKLRDRDLRKQGVARSDLLGETD